MRRVFLALVILPGLISASDASYVGGTRSLWKSGSPIYRTVPAAWGQFTSNALISSVPFVATATYHMNVAGSCSDSNLGNQATQGSGTNGPWCSPNHAVNAGDVVIAEPGAYSSTNLGSGANFGTVSNFPSTTGGIDGTGGIYVANLVCRGTLGSCTVTNTSASHLAIWINASNWAITGWVTTQLFDPFKGCIGISDQGTGANLHTNYNAVVNSIANGCVGSGVAINSADETALLGVIAYNAAIGGTECYSGLDDVVPSNLDTLAGTHKIIAGSFSYFNINGSCGVNSDFHGLYTTNTVQANIGDTTITVASVTGAAAGYPIQVQTAGSDVDGPGLAVGTTVSSIAGLVITLSTPVTATIPVNSSIAITGTTDGEGINFDTWGPSNAGGIGGQYNGQAYVVDNVAWGNGSAGFEIFCANGSTGCSPSLKTFLAHNTFYGNNNDWKREGSSVEIFLNSQYTAGSNVLSITNNIAQSDKLKPPNSTTTANGVPSGTNGFGRPINAIVFGAGSGIIASGNYFFSDPGVACFDFASCDGTNSVAVFNGNVNNNGLAYTTGNTMASPSMANPSSLPTSAPNCTGQVSVYNCMVAAGVVAAIANSVNEGYRSPGPCAADALYPTWIKGINYISVDANGTSLHENTGLTNKPCGM